MFKSKIKNVTKTARTHIRSKQMWQRVWEFYGFHSNRPLTKDDIFPIIILSIIGVLLLAVVFAAEANDITGIWTNEDRDGRIRIYQCGKEYCGDIVWTKDGPEVDVNNPNPGLRNRRIIGLTIMHGFHYAGDSEWKGGEVYDPKTGHTYRGNLRLSAPDSLELRGYVLVPLFGRTTSWTRFEPK